MSKSYNVGEYLKVFKEVARIAYAAGEERRFQWCDYHWKDADDSYTPLKDRTFERWWKEEVEGKLNSKVPNE
jgi:hypothetical protein